MLGAFSCDNTVVANDVIMQRTQRCQGLCDPRQLNPYIVIWLGPEGPQPASQHVIELDQRVRVILKEIFQLPVRSQY